MTDDIGIATSFLHILGVFGSTFTQARCHHLYSTLSIILHITIGMNHSPIHILSVYELPYLANIRLLCAINIHLAIGNINPFGIT